MMYKDDDKIKKEFSKKQNIQLLLFFLMILATPLLIILDPQGISCVKDSLPPIFSVVLLGILVVVGLGTLINWRCPACGGFLGREIFQIQCKRCTFRFK